jgi:hypothetical protein
MKLAELEPDCVKLDTDKAVAIAIACNNYFSLSSIVLTTCLVMTQAAYLCAEDSCDGKDLEGRAWQIVRWGCSCYHQGLQGPSVDTLAMVGNNVQ